jgi:hypothetical protein
VSQPALGRREQRRVDREFDDALEQRMRASGSFLPEEPRRRPLPGSSEETTSLLLRRDSTGAREPQPTVPRDAHAHQRRSPIMDDARAVAEGRKRQLGFGPPP